MIFHRSQFLNTAFKFVEKRAFAEDVAMGNIYMIESGYFRKLEDIYRETFLTEGSVLNRNIKVFLFYSLMDHPMR